MNDAAASRGSHRNTIRFVLDGDVVELDNVDPTRTVLQFLREDLARTGTKEGCAEGDCGACTVVLAELDRDGQDVRVRAVNSCIQFLPTLDGKELITVESLAAGGAAPHPVQKAMVDCHGSQCGFCTPGFVMSLFAMYKSVESPTRREIDDALAGNLCRCTGYRPIIEAARAMYHEPPSDSDWLRQPCGAAATPGRHADALKAIERHDSLSMRRGGRRYFAPRNADELASVVEDYPDATILAGGTDVGIWVTKAHRELETIIYVGGVRELNTIDVGETHIDIGAAVPLSDAMPVILDDYPRLDEVMRRFASPPIRNVATLGGNIANGSPIGDSMPALMAIGTSLVIRSAEDDRELPLDRFYHAYRRNDLRPGEFLEAIRIPRATDGVEVASYKVSKRFDQDISAVCAAFRVHIDAGTATGVRVAYGGMAETVLRARNCEEALEGKSWGEAAIGSAMEALERDFDPIDDMRASAAYRMQVCRNLLRRFYLESRGEPPASVYDYGREG